MKSREKAKRYLRLIRIKPEEATVEQVSEESLLNQVKSQLDEVARDLRWLKKDALEKSQYLKANCYDLRLIFDVVMSLKKRLFQTP